MSRTSTVTRGDIWMVDLGIGIGSEQRGCKPCLVLQNDIGNHFSPTTVIVPITSKIKRFNRTHVLLSDTLNFESYVLCEQIRVIDKSRLKKKLTSIDVKELKIVEETVKIQLDIERGL